MEEERFSDKIKERISSTITVPITFPKNVYSKFKQFAKDEACNTYWNAVEKLLTYYEENEGRNLFGILLSDKIAQLEERIGLSEQDTTNEKTRDQRLKPKFGSNRKGE